jgi:hypothetical protein
MTGGYRERRARARGRAELEWVRRVAGAGFVFGDG